MSTEVTQAEFARIRCVSEAMVSRWKSNGRLVMNADGTRVLVDESIARLDRELDPLRGGDRSARVTPRAPAVMAHAGAIGTDLGAVTSGSVADAARSEKLERTALLRLERLELEGTLVLREQVEAEAFRRARQAQEALMAIPDRLAAPLAAESDADRVRELLDTELRHVIAQIAAREPAPTAEAA